MLEYTFDRVFISGFAFSLRFYIGITALLANLLSLYLFNATRHNLVLMIIGISIIIDFLNVWTGMPNRNSTRVLLMNSIFSAIQGSLLSTFVSLRFSKTLSVLLQKLVIICQPLGFVGILCLTLSTDKFFDELLGLICFAVLFLPVYGLNLYSCFLIIYSIKSAEVKRDKFYRILLISNLLTAVYAVGPIVLGILTMQPITDPFANVVVSIIYFLMSASDLLMMINKVCTVQTVLWIASRHIK